MVVDELILINNRIHAKSILAGKVYSLLKPVTPGLIYLFFSKNYEAAQCLVHILVNTLIDVFARS